MIYQVCNVNCPEICDTAIVNIQVKGLPITGDCWVPNVMTPNGDGLNDLLKIPCLTAFPDNEIRVYNRWGDRVYDSAPYNNNWGGTFKGELLPPGTYYYILRLSPEDTEGTQGFFTILR